MSIDIYRIDNQADLSGGRPAVALGRWVAQTTQSRFSLRRYLSVLTPRVVRLTGQAERPWESTTIRRLAALAQLERGWDGAEAPAISETALIGAQWFLRVAMKPSTIPPNVVPTAAGGVQLEWHAKGFDVEVELGPGSEVNIYVGELATGDEYEGSGFNGYWRLARALGLLS